MLGVASIFAPFEFYLQTNVRHQPADFTQINGQTKETAKL
jgi:hypothetical protein